MPAPVTISKIARPKNFLKIISLLREHYSNAKTALNFKTPIEMLVATILSAQCTDKRVNMVTPALFKQYKTAADYAEADLSELEKLIHSTGFFRNKARNIKGSGKVLVGKFGGKMPRRMEEMLELPGVARKTANVVLYNVYGVVEGVVVDTHVGRLARRLGFSSGENAEKVEQDLMALVPKKDWANISFWLVDHGRAVCKARKPRCADCFLNKVCPSAFKV